MSPRQLPQAADALVVGAGPAGLATALALRRRGLSVVVVDRGQPPIDKACGEGLMPDGVAALRRLGVELGDGDGAVFRGIRFIEGDTLAEAAFAGAHGIGVRRTVLHRRLVEHAEAAGAVIGWRRRVTGLEPAGARIGDGVLRCAWIVGADGLRSQVRQWIGASLASSTPRRIGVRRHFRVTPWSEFVEVHWRAGCQAYVTPVGPQEVGIALVGEASIAGFALLPQLFPRLAERLRDAAPASRIRGAFTASTRWDSVARGPLALVGDASGSVDAVTGDGLSLAFRQAECLAAAIAGGDLVTYEAAHRRIGRLPSLMARLLLLMDAHPALRRRAIRALAAHPPLFARLLAARIGQRRRGALPLDLSRLTLRLVLPRGQATP